MDVQAANVPALDVPTEINYYANKARAADVQRREKAQIHLT